MNVEAFFILFQLRLYVKFFCSKINKNIIFVATTVLLGSCLVERIVKEVHVNAYVGVRMNFYDFFKLKCLFLMLLTSVVKAGPTDKPEKLRVMVQHSQNVQTDG